jgi:hypothetical protein
LLQKKKNENPPIGQAATPPTPPRAVRRDGPMMVPGRGAKKLGRLDCLLSPSRVLPVPPVRSQLTHVTLAGQVLRGVTSHDLATCNNKTEKDFCIINVVVRLLSEVNLPLEELSCMNMDISIDFRHGGAPYGDDAKPMSANVFQSELPNRVFLY